VVIGDLSIFGRVNGTGRRIIGLLDYWIIGLVRAAIALRGMNFRKNRYAMVLRANTR
jgi:hypothetical protein